MRKIGSCYQKSFHLKISEPAKIFIKNFENCRFLLYYLFTRSLDSLLGLINSVTIMVLQLTKSNITVKPVYSGHLLNPITGGVSEHPITGGDDAILYHPAFLDNN